MSTPTPPSTGSTLNAQQWLELALTFLASLAPLAGGPWGAIVAALGPLITALITQIKDALSQTSEWTPEQVADYEARLNAVIASLPWQPRP